MKKKFISCGVAAVILLGNCTPVQKSRTTKTMDISGSGITSIPVVADLSVKETKATGTASASSAALIEKAKQDAIADAIENSNADVLVEPVFKTTTIGARLTVTVTGFPANYKNFRNATPSDTTVLKIRSGQKVQTDNRQPMTAGKKKGVGAAIGTMLGVGLIILIALLASA